MMCSEFLDKYGVVFDVIPFDALWFLRRSPVSVRPVVLGPVRYTVCTVIAVGKAFAWTWNGRKYGAYPEKYLIYKVKKCIKINNRLIILDIKIYLKKKNIIVDCSFCQLAREDLSFSELNLF